MRIRNEDAGRGCQHGGDPDRRADTEPVGEQPGCQGAEGEPGVAPEPVDPNRSGTPLRMGDVPDRGQERRVDQGSAGTQENRRDCPGGE